MVLGLGTDIVSIDRIRRAMQSPRFLERFLTPAEREFCHSPETVAGRWAAKEAIQKALPRRVRWQDIEVLRDPRGCPVVSRPEGHRIVVSIAHERDFATATAVLLGEPDQA